jgi:CDP-4-dehydro-6-deoxyglucose reductase, E3
LARVGARVVTIARPAEDIRQIEFHLENDFDFEAGQYLNVCHPTGLVIPFSIASAPEHLPRLSIHFRPLPGAPDAQAMLDLLATEGPFELDGPFGDVKIHGATDTPLCLVAGGTGVSQCHAIVDHLGFCRQAERVRLLWSVSTPSHLYDLAFFEGARAQHDWFELDVALDAPGETNGAVAHIRRCGVPPEPVIILAGSPGFVYAVVDAIAAGGGDPARLRSDVFAYAPRE